MLKIRVAALVIALLAAWTVTLLTQSSFFVARGSDATVEIYAASGWTMALTLLAVSGVWIASVVRREMRTWVRWLLRVGGLFALGLATHLVVFNNRRGMLEEHWFQVRMDRAAYSRAEGLSAEWTLRRERFGFVLEARDHARSVFVFTGVPPWNLDVEASLPEHGY